MQDDPADPFAWISTLPAPSDDGGAAHLIGRELPPIQLVDHRGIRRDPSTLASRLVLFVYPATGAPGRDPLVDPAPGWDAIPGAPGCTVQALGYRDAWDRIRALGFDVIGLSGQPTAEQEEFAARQAIPFPLLSDPTFALAGSLRLPTFTIAQRRFYRRLSMVVIEGRIVHIIYPVFPPHTNAQRVLEWLELNEARAGP
jgi:peroxiredoxin